MSPHANRIVSPSLDSDVIGFNLTNKEIIKVFLNPTTELLLMLFNGPFHQDQRFFREYFVFDETYFLAKENSCWVKFVVPIPEADNDKVDDNTPTWSVKLTSSSTEARFLSLDLHKSKISKEEALGVISELGKPKQLSVFDQRVCFDILRHSFDQQDIRVTVDITTWSKGEDKPHCFVNMSVVGTKEEVVAFQAKYGIKKWNSYSKMNFYIAHEHPELFQELVTAGRLFPITSTELSTLSPSPDVIRELIGRSYYAPFPATKETAPLDRYLNQVFQNEELEKVLETLRSQISAGLNNGTYYYYKYYFYSLQFQNPAKLEILVKFITESKSLDIDKWADLLFPIAIEEDFNNRISLYTNPVCALLLVLSAKLGNCAARHLVTHVAEICSSKSNIPKAKKNFHSDDPEKLYPLLFWVFDKTDWKKLRCLSNLKDFRKKAVYFHIKSQWFPKTVIADCQNLETKMCSPFVDFLLEPFQKDIGVISDFSMKYARHPYVRYNSYVAYQVFDSSSQYSQKMTEEIKWFNKLVSSPDEKVEAAAWKLVREQLQSSQKIIIAKGQAEISATQ